MGSIATIKKLIPVLKEKDQKYAFKFIEERRIEDLRDLVVSARKKIIYSLEGKDDEFIEKKEIYLEDLDALVAEVCDYYNAINPPELEDFYLDDNYD